MRTQTRLVLGSDSIRLAFTITYPWRHRIRKVGEIHFAPDQATIETIAHEIDHAVTAYMFRYMPDHLDIYENPDDDEIRAQIVDRLVKQFYESVGLSHKS